MHKLIGQRMPDTVLQAVPTSFEMWVGLFDELFQSAHH